ncbi:hypothetical protein [Micrococcus sp. IITD107]|uniref:hypothetical protein n=1 Tax=Micrococcus sp. IITD107 TaxID=3342790 RepID=UPI0035BA036C
MRVTANAKALLNALAALTPFVDKGSDAGPAGMIHLSYVQHGGLVATAYGWGPAAAWVDAESEDGELASFAIEARDAATVQGAFRRSTGGIVIDVESKVLKAVSKTVQIVGTQAVESRVEKDEIAYSITFREDSGLFGNRMLKVSTAAQPEVNLAELWEDLEAPLLHPVPALDEHSASVVGLSRFKAAENVYGKTPKITAAAPGGSLLVRVGQDFIGRALGYGESGEFDRDRSAWSQRLRAQLEAAA